MIAYGEATHTIRARTLSRAFSRVRAFLERCTDVREAAYGFGMTVPMTLDQIAAELAALDDSDPMASINGYTWSFDVGLRDPRTGAPVPCEKRSHISLLAHVGRLCVTFRLAFPYDAIGDELARFGDVMKETMGVKLSAQKLRRR